MYIDVVSYVRYARDGYTLSNMLYIMLHMCGRAQGYILSTITMMFSNPQKLPLKQRIFNFLLLQGLSNLSVMDGLEIVSMLGL